MLTVGAKMTDKEIEFIKKYRVAPILKQRVLNPDIAEFFWATCERYKEVKNVFKNRIRINRKSN